MIELDLFPSKLFVFENFLNRHRQSFLDYLIDNQPTVLDENQTLEVGFDISDPNLNIFRFVLQEKLKLVLSQSLVNKTRISSAWVNYSNKKSIMGKHDHLRLLPNVCVYTASYYPNFEPGMGNIRMHDPNKFNHLINDYDRRYYDIDLKMDTLILFPGWLEHEVLENTTPKIRISFMVDVSLT